VSATWRREKSGTEELLVDHKVHTRLGQLLDRIETFEMVDERMDGTLGKIEYAKVENEQNGWVGNQI